NQIRKAVTLLVSGSWFLVYRRMRTDRESYDILDRALARASAEADAVFASTDHNISRFANSSVHQNMSEVSAWLKLRVVVNGAMGTASTTSFDDDELARTAELAREAAKHSGALPGFAGLYRDNEPLPLVDTFDAHAASLAPAEKARALRAIFDRGRENGVLFAGSYATGASSIACANTHGVRRYTTMTSCDATVIALRGDASGYATAVDRRNVDVLTLGDEATLKAT